LNLDRNPNPDGPLTGTPDGCGQLIDPAVTLTRRVMARSETQALTVTLTSASAETCAVEVTLNAPHFRLSPPEPRQEVVVGPGQQVESAWILTPEELGTFDLVVTVGGAITVLGLTVTNALGLTALQLQILSTIGSVLGPMLTFPWWLEQWQAWQERKRDRAREEKDAKEPVRFE
jgi:hypothetical protein